MERRESEIVDMGAILTGIFTSLAASAISGAVSSIYRRIQENKSLEDKLKDAFEKAVCRYFKDELQQEKVIYHDTEKYIQMLKDELHGKAIDFESERYKKLYNYFEEEIAKNPSLADYVEITNLRITQEMLDKNSSEIKGLIEGYGEKIVAQNENLKAQNEKLMEGMEALLEKVSARSNLSSNPATIRSLISDFGQDIKELKIKSAYRHLENIQRSLINESNEDMILHAAVQCSMGICARFISNKKSLNHYEEAYRQIKSKDVIDTALYVQILEGLIYWACKEKQDTEAKTYTEELITVAPDNSWIYVPELIKADDLDATYQAIPERVQKFQALTNAVMIGCKAQEHQMGIDIEAYTYQNLTELTYDNFSLWVFDMSVAATKFARQFTVRKNIHAIWNKEAEVLYNMTHRYRELLKETELANLMPDTVFLENLTGYLKDQDELRLEIMEQEKGKPHFKELYYLGYAMMLMDKEKYPKALELIKGYGEDASVSILNMRLAIAFRSGNEDEGKAVIKEAAEKKRSIPDHLLPNFIQTIHIFFSELEPYTKDIVIETSQSKYLFDQFVSFKQGEEIDILKLQEEESEIEPLLYPILSILYKEKLGIEKAIDLVRKCADNTVLDLRTITLLSYYKEDSRYNIDRYHLLRDLRINDETNRVLLSEELPMAEAIMDYEAVRDISQRLRKEVPNDLRILCYHIKALRILGKIDEVIALEPIVNGMPINDMMAVKVIVSIYESIHELPFAVEWLYRAILITRNQDLKDFFYILSLRPEVGKMIYSPHDIIELGDIAELEAEGEKREVEIVGGSVYADLIGKRVGETVMIHLREDTNITIVAAHNKYYGMCREVHTDVECQMSKNIKSFTIGNLEESANPLEELFKIIGDPKQAQKEHDAKLEQYKKRELPLFTFAHGGDVVGMMNLLFDPHFMVYDFPVKFYTQNVTKDDIKDIPLVLDMSSLILLSELHRRYGVVWEKKFLVPISLKMTLCETLTNEECGDFALLHKEALDHITLNYIDSTKSDLWNITRSMLDWIDHYCEVQIVEAKLLMQKHPNSTSLSLTETDSALLATMDNILLTQDWMLMEKIASVRGISVQNWLAFMGAERTQDTFQYMLECGNVGGEMSADYIVEQYDAYREGKENSYQTCVDNIPTNPSNIHSVMDACLQILCGKNDDRSKEEVTKMLRKLLQSLTKRSIGVLVYQVSQLQNSDLMLCLKNAYEGMIDVNEY